MWLHPWKQSYTVGLHLIQWFLATVCKTVRPMLSDRWLSVCLSCLSVTLVYCGQTVGRIKMKLGMQVGLVPGHIVLDGNPAPSPKGHSPQFSVHVCCGEMGELTKMPLGTKVGVGPSDIVLCGNPAPPKRGTAPVFGPCLLWPNGRPSQLLLSTGILKTCCQISEKCRGSQLWLHYCLRLACC